MRAVESSGLLLHKAAVTTWETDEGKFVSMKTPVFKTAPELPSIKEVSKTVATQDKLADAIGTKVAEAVKQQPIHLKIRNESELKTCYRSLGKSQAEHEIEMAKRGMGEITRLSGLQRAIILEQGIAQFGRVPDTYMMKGIEVTKMPRG